MLKLLITICIIAAIIMPSLAQTLSVVTIKTGFPQANLIANYNFTERAGQLAFNRKASSFSVPKNLAGAPEQSFSLPYWDISATTTTENAAINPVDSLLTATRITGTGGGSFIDQSITLGLAQYTLSIYVKSNTGLSQTFRMGYSGGAGFILGSDQTATTTWTRFSTTVTDSIDAIFPFVNGTGAGTFDLLIYAPQLETGPTASAYAPPVGHIQNGLNLAADSKDFTWNSAGISLNGASSGQDGLAIFENPISISQVSIYAAVKFNGDGNDVDYSPIVGESFGSNKLNLNLLDNDFPGGTFSGTNIKAYLTNLKDGFWHTISLTYDGTTLRFYLETTEMASATAIGLSSVSIQKLFVGQVNEFAWGNVGIGFIALYNIGHDISHHTTVVHAIQTNMASRGVTINDLSQIIAFEGDSLTAVPEFSGPPSYTRLALASYTPFAQGRDFAVVSSNIANVTARAAAVDAFYDPSKDNKLLVFVGANDQSEGAALFFAALKSYCQARRATGWHLALGMVLPQSTSGFNAFRNSVNSMILSDPSFYDSLVRWDTDSSMGCDSCPSNATLFNGIHYTSAGNVVLAPYAVTALNALP